MRRGNDVTAFAPPMIVTAEEIDEMAGILDESMAAAQQELLRARR